MDIMMLDKKKLIFVINLLKIKNMQTLKTPKNILIVKPVAKLKDPTKMTKEEFDAKCNEAREQWKRGEFTRLETNEDIRKFIESL